MWNLFEESSETDISSDDLKRDINILNAQKLFKKHFSDEAVEGSNWQADALCSQTDPEAFFPEGQSSAKDARRVCKICPVQERCLKYALENDERYGIWGGSLERDRRKFFKEKEVAVG